MSWIKDNKFIVGLGGGTLLAATLLIIFGLQGSKRYDEALERFGVAADEASSFEKLALYPKPENRDGKTKAIADYRQSLDGLQTAFEPFRPKELKNITPQEFTNNLLAANAEARKAFEDARVEVPEAFFLGFEGYKTALAPGKITGILDYQLANIKSLMLTLAESKPTALKNLYRPPLAEEENQNFTPGGAAARPFPLEITFSGTEDSLRKFLTSITGYKDKFVVVRVMRVMNEKKDPPRAADAKFDKPAANEPAGGDAAPFGGGFVLPGDEAPVGEAAPAAPATPAVDSSRILAQVLGNEQVNVFIRLDVLQFLPSKKLP